MGQARAHARWGLGEEVEEGGGALQLDGVGVEDLDGFCVDLVMVSAWILKVTVGRIASRLLVHGE